MLQPWTIKISIPSCLLHRSTYYYQHYIGFSQGKPCRPVGFPSGAPVDFRRSVCWDPRDGTAFPVPVLGKPGILTRGGIHIDHFQQRSPQLRINASLCNSSRARKARELHQRILLAAVTRTQRIQEMIKTQTSVSVQIPGRRHVRRKRR